MTQALRRLIDLPGVADLETRALMKPGYADPSRRDEFPEVDEVLNAVFGLTAEQAEDAARPDDWDGIERLSPQEQADLFEAEGWDVRDAKRKPREEPMGPSGDAEPDTVAALQQRVAELTAENAALRQQLAALSTRQ